MIRDLQLKLVTAVISIAAVFSINFLYEGTREANLFGFALIYFFFTSYVTFEIASKIINLLHNCLQYSRQIILKITYLFTLPLLFIVASTLTSFLIWSEITQRALTWDQVVLNCFTWSLIGFSFIFYYKLLILYKEKEIDHKVIQELDKERSNIEMSVLKNAIEPHFLFNSLSVLTQLIQTNPEKAVQYNIKLAEVYQYLLINKGKDFITLSDELEFIKKYFYLLQIKYDQSIKLSIHIPEKAARSILIIPGALQTLIENAIKHNQFSNTAPLLIDIEMSAYYIKVVNTIRPKQTIGTSTKTGLQNLKERYNLLFQKNIIVHKHENFIVKLPLIKTAYYGEHHYHRR